MAEPFRDALKRYIASGYAAPEAMRATWQDVKIGRVERPRTAQQHPQRWAAGRRSNPLPPERDLREGVVDVHTPFGDREVVFGRPIRRVGLQVNPLVRLARCLRMGQCVRLSTGALLCHDRRGYYIAGGRGHQANPLTRVEAGELLEQSQRLHRAARAEQRSATSRMYLQRINSGSTMAAAAANPAVPAEQLRAGDVILPPEREISLWMRRHLREHRLPESALELTVEAIREGAPDKRGRWLIVSAQQSAAWLQGRPGTPFTFKVRPGTPWPLLRRERGNPARFRATRTVDMLEDGTPVVRHVFYGRTPTEARGIERAHVGADRSLAAALAGRPYRGVQIRAKRPAGAPHGNPPGGGRAQLTKFYDRVLEVRGAKGRRFGFQPGTRFKHPFTRSRPVALGVDRSGLTFVRRGEVLLRGRRPIYAQLGAA